jgi:hypothetical protein
MIEEIKVTEPKIDHSDKKPDYQSFLSSSYDSSHDFGEDFAE